MGAIRGTPNSHALVRDSQGNVTDLNSPQKLVGWGAAYGINDAGRVLGTMRSSVGIYTDNQFRPLGGWDLMGAELLYSGDINSAGRAVATDIRGGPSYYFAASGEGTELVGATGMAINNRGEVTSSCPELFIWKAESGLTRIALPEGFTSARGQDITDGGVIAGSLYDRTTSRCRAFIDRAAAEIQALPLLAPYDSRQALAVTEQGRAIGFAMDSSGPKGSGKPVLWDNGAACDLNSLIPADSGWVLGSVSDMSNSGYAAGYGWYHGRAECFFLRPIPDPSGALMVFGAVTALLLGRRRSVFTAAAGPAARAGAGRPPAPGPPAGRSSSARP